MDKDEYIYLKYDVPETLAFQKPTGYLHFMNITVGLFGKLPNKFQRFMIKIFFGMEVNEDDS